MRLLINGVAWASAFALLGAANSAAAATLQPGFSETLVASGLRNPTAMAFSPDGRLFVCEQAGTLRVVKGGALLATPFVTLTVNSSGERGLLGIAFDPNFASNQYVYVYYTATSPTIHNRLSRFTASGDVATGVETVLLDLETLGATNHNGGAIHFGGDGKLYVAVGENAVSANAQTLTNRLGKILRINSNGTIPADNPFYTTAVGANRSIWALGLRNPFTFAIQPISGVMYINDVGQNTWEEINQGVAGSNYGWPDTEGYTTNAQFRSPLYAYDHGNGCAIAGGAFHSMLRPQFPIKYWGAYFFADLCGGWIRSRGSDGVVASFASGISQPVDLALSSDGSLYYLARGVTATTGVVYRINYTNAPPRIDITANGSDGPIFLNSGNPLQVEFSFDAGAAGPLPSASVYVGILTPSHVFWLDPVRGFVPDEVARAYNGPLGTFAPSVLITLPDVGVLSPGLYWWVILVDDDGDGVADVDASDMVLTILS
jgi:glucose/arabinose dehydrogenase